MRIRRRVGPGGRVMIPKAVRESLGIKEGDAVVMEARDGKSS
ncbi:AbrB/MazE/SpoVT family DNA-binding domain-containing protein [Infirmifilum lucidum]|uniref:AbrB/MazE/SpoVT family DNA-binding domain-containing protein n=1 Tax=Infirmifilum lucidum TaxID=2776706 RepID=A0A7L9FH31_9CREN|nr:AbrB/MazE/SpoVT family DNA-binding domain-containing protein [Infirmifilum lucidum]QOJ79059.1 AbrB/MazE/SpoVT family DNA-binding domain-containing protein [Infirmifilum lucidum]